MVGNKTVLCRPLPVRSLWYFKSCHKFLGLFFEVAQALPDFKTNQHVIGAQVHNLLSENLRIITFWISEFFGFQNGRFLAYILTFVRYNITGDRVAQWKSGRKVAGLRLDPGSYSLCSQ